MQEHLGCKDSVVVEWEDILVRPRVQREVSFRLTTGGEAWKGAILSFVLIHVEQLIMKIVTDVADQELARMLFKMSR